jgi:hypothetical protein
MTTPYGRCTRNHDFLGFPSPYEADCVYKHRYVFTLEHHRILTQQSPARRLPFANRLPRAVWRGTCTGLASSWHVGNLDNVPRAKVVSLSKRHPNMAASP